MIEQRSTDFENNYLFTGHELDRETNLYYAHARYLNPRLGVWMSVDPMMEELQNYSPYTYSVNNPTNVIDPDGEFPLPLVTAAAGALIFGGIELGGQMLSGKSFSKVDWADVGVEMVKGGLLGSGVGASSATLIEAGSVAIKASVDIDSKGRQTVFESGENEKSIGLTLFDAGADVAGNFIGGAAAKKAGNYTQKQVQNAIKTETKSTKQLVKARNNYNRQTNGGRVSSREASEKYSKAQSNSTYTRKQTVRAQMTNAVVKGPVGSAANNGIKNFISEGIKNIFGIQ